MEVTLGSAELQTARNLFQEQFSSEEYEGAGFYQAEAISASRIVFRFETDDLIRDVRAWGAAAISCGLVSSFGVEVP